MFKRMLLPLLIGTTLFGGLLDFRTLENAEEAYANKQYTKAAALYESIEDKNDDLRYNLGDAYYKAKKYEEALTQYEQVQKSELRAKTLHNMGNAYANTKKINEAISAYEEALKLDDDEDTKFNLELLKKEKEQQEKQEKDQSDKGQKKEEQEKQEDQQNSENDQKKGQKSDDESDEEKEDKQSDSKRDQEKKEQEEREDQAKEDEESKKDESEKEQEEMKQDEANEDPLSDMQERKYEKMLDKRGIKTLMVPLKTEGDPYEETTAW